MKTLIRVTLILASLCMVIANWNNGFFALAASVLFSLANISSLIYNELKVIRNVRQLQIEMIKVWNKCNKRASSSAG